MNPLPVLTWVARALLEPLDFERMALPALADAALERPSSGPTLAWRADTAWQLLRIVLLSSALRWYEAAVSTRWWILLCAALAGLAGCIGLQHSAPSMAWKHAAFLGVGLVAGALVATLPRPLLRPAALLLTALSAAALACVPIWGHSFDGARRWLQIGPLMIHVSTLVVPVFAAAAAWGARKAGGWVAVGLATLALGAIAVQPDPASALVYGIVALVTCRTIATRLAVLAASSAACIWAFRHSAPVTPVLHVEHAPALLARNGPVWFAVAMFALASVAAFSIVVWLRARGRSDALGAAPAAAGMIALLAIPWGLGDGGIPWISFGGSASVAAFLLAGMLLRAERGSRTAALRG
jgi:hypothetical protein